MARIRAAQGATGRVRTGVRTTAGSSPPSMPAGATAVWYAANYTTSPRKVIPNSLASAPLGNLFPYTTYTPYNVFNAGNSVTRTMRTANGPAGYTNSADRILGTGNCYEGIQMTLAAGQYTLAVDVKSNTGSSQNFRLGNFDLGAFSSATATTSWQTFTKPFTVVTPSNHLILTAYTPDGTTGWDLLIDNRRIFAGSSDLGAEAPAGHMYFDVDPLVSPGKTTSPSAGIVDLTTQGSALMTFPVGTNLAAFTAGAVVRRTSASNSGEMPFFSSPELGFSTFALMIEEGDNRWVNYVTGIGGSFTGLWDANGSGWHLITWRCSSTTFDLFFDNTRIYTKSGSFSAPAMHTMLAYAINSLAANTTSHQMNSAFWYPSALTNTQITNEIFPALVAKAALNSITVTQGRIVSAEGDSITAGGIYYGDYSATMTTASVGVNYSISGSTIVDLISRGTTVDAAFPPNLPVGVTANLTVLIGANDMGGYGGATNTDKANNWAAQLWTYTDARRLTGWKVHVATVLPNGTTSGVNTFNSIRNIANPLIRAAVGAHIDGYIDFAADAQIGVDDSFDLFPTLWADTIHPSTLGQHSRLSPIYSTYMNAQP